MCSTFICTVVYTDTHSPTTKINAKAEPQLQPGVYLRTGLSSVPSTIQTNEQGHTKAVSQLYRAHGSDFDDPLSASLKPAARALTKTRNGASACDTKLQGFLCYGRPAPWLHIPTTPDPLWTERGVTVGGQDQKALATIEVSDYGTRWGEGGDPRFLCKNLPRIFEKMRANKTKEDELQPRLLRVSWITGLQSTGSWV